MELHASAPTVAGRPVCSRRALLGTVSVLILGSSPAWAQHGGHDTAQHASVTAATDSTPKMRAMAAEQRTWLGVRLAFIGIALGAYVAWWRYHVVKERRAKLAKKQGRTGSQLVEKRHPSVRQGRRR